MNCPKCNYVLSDFDQECPRCTNFGFNSSVPSTPPINPSIHNQSYRSGRFQITRTPLGFLLLGIVIGVAALAWMIPNKPEQIGVQQPNTVTQQTDRTVQPAAVLPEATPTSSENRVTRAEVDQAVQYFYALHDCGQTIDAKDLHDSAGIERSRAAVQDAITRLSNLRIPPILIPYGAAKAQSLLSSLLFEEMGTLDTASLNVGNGFLNDRMQDHWKNLRSMAQDEDDAYNGMVDKFKRDYSSEIP